MSLQFQVNFNKDKKNLPLNNIKDFSELQNKIKDIFHISTPFVILYSDSTSEKNYILNDDDLFDTYKYIIKNNKINFNLTISDIDEEILKDLKNLETEKESVKEDYLNHGSKKDTRNRKINMDYNYKGFYKHSYNQYEVARIMRVKLKKKNQKMKIETDESIQKQKEIQHQIEKLKEIDEKIRRKRILKEKENSCQEFMVSIFN